MDPPYQRRSVWNQSFKDYFVDTVLLGLPAPAIFLFEETQPCELSSDSASTRLADSAHRSGAGACGTKKMPAAYGRRISSGGAGSWRSRGGGGANPKAV